MKVQRKYEIFVGSTKRDLSGAREAITRAILEAGHIPCGMELWSAGTKPTKAAILNRLKSCDMHVVLLGARYGYVPIDSGQSITEWEFEQSEKSARPVIAFFLDEKSFKKERQKILNSSEERDQAEKDNDELLQNFRRRVMESRICREFQPTPAGINDLKASCINALNEVIDSLAPLKESGWIRASSHYGKTLNAIQDNWFLHRILNKLQEFNWLREGVTRQKEEKDALGKVFWHQMECRIKRSKIRDVFFESGSTLAFVTYQFEMNVLRPIDDYKWRITTNNVVILQELLLHTDIEVAPLPPGRPTNQFGGMYSRELIKNPEPAPIRPRSLYAYENEAIKRLMDRLNRDSENRLFLISASGWVISCDEPSFNGINAETHPDLLFKRAVLSTGQPVVCFLTSDKIGSCFRLHKHFPIFGSDFVQDEILTRQPIAICLSYKSNPELHNYKNLTESTTGDNLAEIYKLISYLEGLGFDAEYAHEYLENEKISVRLLANNKFKQIFDNSGANLTKG